VLALALVVPKANRTPQVLLILLPVLAVQLLWWGVSNVLPFDSNSNELFGMLVHCLSVELAMLGLLGHLLARNSWLRTFLAALAVAVGVALAAACSFSLSLSDVMLQFLLVLLILTLATIVGLGLAALKCRRRYSGPRFGLHLALWMVLSSTVGMYLLFVVWCLTSGIVPGQIWPMVASVTMAGAVLGAGAFLISLPFLLLALTTPLFRSRLMACLRLEHVRRRGDVGPASATEEQETPPANSP
jgi:hypothetical protein